MRGSVIFDIHGSNSRKGVVHAGRAADMFCHSLESWAAMWDGEIFVKGKVRADVTVEWVNKEGLAFWQLRWSVVGL